MKAYRISVNLKLGLIVFAVGIAVASLAYTSRLVDRLREREQAVIELWAAALELISDPANQAINPYQRELAGLDTLLRRLGGGAAGVDTEALASYRRAVGWAQGMPPAVELGFVDREILSRDALFEIPAIVVDPQSDPYFTTYRNVDVPAPLYGLDTADSARAVAKLERLQAWMAEVHDPIELRLGLGESVDRTQYVYYGESTLVRELRWFPYVQLVFVGLFIAVGYLGFSYVRRSEQSSLWVGMAKEAAHQLGTPISSLMGWVELMRTPGLGAAQQVEAVDEVENDIQRLQRVTSRFSDIGSKPKLRVQELAPVVETTADYMRRRMPARGKKVELSLDVPQGVQVPLNAELFEWVIENLIKNALDAIDQDAGAIRVDGEVLGDLVRLDVTDTGKGIERRQWKNVFRPGYSTKKRGWGLGLSLAKRIVEDYHGGDLTLHQSRVGQGTTFRIELPRVPTATG